MDAGAVGSGAVSAAAAVEAARAAARLARQVELALTAVDLSLPQYRVLALLSEGSPAASALAGSLSVSRPSVTAVVDGLITRGLAARGDDPADRRKVRHVLTAKGRRSLRQADAAVAARLGEVAATLGDECTAGLLAWSAALDEYRRRCVLAAQRRDRDPAAVQG